MKTFTNTHTLLYHINDSISIPLRYSIIEGTTWFIGKDVAAICGYKDTWRAIKNHVSPENTDYTIFNSRKLIIINYAGFKEIDPTEEHLNWFINHLSEADSPTEAPTVFNHPEFGELRTVEIDGVVWFVGKDVAEALGYSNTSKAIITHVADEDKIIKMLPNSQNGKTVGKTYIINESGLYSLILSSKLPSAKEFKHWVTSEVLPSIRKTGGYVNPSQSDLFLDTYLPFADQNTRLLFKTTLDTIQQQNNTIPSRITLFHIKKTSFVILHQIFH